MIVERFEYVLDLKHRIVRYFQATPGEMRDVPAWPDYTEEPDRSGRKVTAFRTRVGQRLIVREYSTGNVFSREMTLGDLDRGARDLWEDERKRRLNDRRSA